VVYCHDYGQYVLTAFGAINPVKPVADGWAYTENLWGHEARAIVQALHGFDGKTPTHGGHKVPAHVTLEQALAYGGNVEALVAGGINVEDFPAVEYKDKVPHFPPPPKYPDDVPIPVGTVVHFIHTHASGTSTSHGAVEQDNGSTVTVSPVVYGKPMKPVQVLKVTLL
jgi:hypothetical protein